MSDLIDRQAAIDAMTECYWSIMGDEPPKLDEKTALYVDLKQAVKRLPTADLSEYSDKLWKTAYERGKRDGAKEVTWKEGTWEAEHCDTSNGRSYRFWRCSECHVCAGPAMVLSVYDLRYCPYCGARMTEVRDG